MSEIIHIQLRLDKIPRDKITEIKRRDGETGMLVNLSIIPAKGGQDQFGNSHTVVIRKTKAEFDAKSPTIFCGSGRVAYTQAIDTGSPAPAQPSVPKQAPNDDYPF